MMKYRLIWWLVALLLGGALANISMCASGCGGEDQIIVPPPSEVSPVPGEVVPREPQRVTSLEIANVEFVFNYTMQQITVNNKNDAAISVEIAKDEEGKPPILRAYILHRKSRTENVQAAIARGDKLIIAISIFRPVQPFITKIERRVVLG